MKKNTLLYLLLLLCTASNLVAQEEGLPPRWEEPRAPTEDSTPDSLLIVEFPDSSAQFPGGNEALLKFIPANMKVPDSLKIEELQGRAFVRFIIETDGTVTHPEILRGIHPLIDREILRTIKKMPKWKPAYHRGKAVRSRYIIPVKILFQ